MFSRKISPAHLILVSVAFFVIMILSGIEAGAASLASVGKLDLSLEPYASGLSDPVGITNAGTGDKRLFVIERAGRIKIVQVSGDVLSTPFLDISDRVDASSTEEGLLGLAFDPNYANNGFFYVNYINTSLEIRRTRISRFKVSAQANVADPNSEEILLTVTQPYSNHNAGDLHFGPDGYLYIPLGDGGRGGDPDNNAQNPATLLGKIVRIDVDTSLGSPADCRGSGNGNYSVPAANPWMDGTGGTCDEIWAMGLRNPWRSSFDRDTGDFYLGDVGQDEHEEIDFQPAGSDGGENYGWRCYEGNSAYDLRGCGTFSDYVFPIFEYSNPNDGCSITGGYVYRGNSSPFMVGHYLFTDYCSGNFWDLADNGNGWAATKHTNLSGFGYVAFGEDAAGELYVVNRSSGRIFHLVENSVGAMLTISKSGPIVAAAGDPITYTLTVTNSGNMMAANLIISDTIPAGASYLPGSGGNRNGSVVGWQISGLAAEGVIRRSFAVTATQTVINSDYGVTADNGVVATGRSRVSTLIVKDIAYVPIILKE